MLDTTFYQIAYLANPQGQFCNNLEKAIDDMDAERPVEELVSKGMDYLKKLLATSKEALAEDLYFADKLVSNNSAQAHPFRPFKKFLKTYMRKQLLQYNPVTLNVLLYGCYTSFMKPITITHTQEINLLLTHALKVSGGQSVEQAVIVPHCEVMDNIMEGDLSGSAFYSCADNPIAGQMMDRLPAPPRPCSKKWGKNERE